MEKQDLQELKTILKNWKDHSQDNKKIENVLKRLLQFKFASIEDLNSTLQLKIAFHKGICKAQNIPDQWFEHSKKIDKYFKKCQQQLKKKKIKKPAQLVKKPSQVVDIPASLCNGIPQPRHQVYKYMYKSFISGFDDKELQPRVVPFIHDLYDAVQEQFSNLLFDKQKSVRNRIDRICQNLNRASCSKSKIEMLKGIKTPKQVAENKDEIYISEEERQKQLEQMRQYNKAQDTGYYDQIKKKIFRDASQECRFCHKNAAYCYDQKQIRASDQPMTRFMTCNSCNKNWRD